MSNTKNIILLITVIVFFGLVIYWYEIRPAKIRKMCVETSKATSKEMNLSFSVEDISAIKLYYDFCIWGNGIKK